MSGTEPTGIDLVRAVGPETGERFVPPLSDYEVLSPRWAEEEFRVFGGAATSFTGGYWRGEPGTVRFESWPYDEICVILKGRVAVRDTAGRSKEFGPGESFHIPQGFQGDWITVEPSEKVFIAVSR
ncbi:cupin domain-containing protein [Spongiactinospora sp. TRM90649]|uniref:cupin domain-containing protein n=1 Tax=Spongiactinospora sp. TRM90649 TaxID=3031114 RepID=UPI0023F822DF|nr:cupin domain-containing protein [Spongiactinospora sp. TRM90649]MDF5752670.1 cupin domain-containing protein [Spongiactinospora sp. TRM90649]